MIEKINWVSVADRLPDAEETVLVFLQNANEPCWPGYIGEDDVWFYADGTAINDAPSYWSHIPGGPGAQPIFDNDQKADPVEPFARLPRQLTAENGAKALLMGEFFEELMETCLDCAGDCNYEDDDCGTCNGTGEVATEVPVSWTTIKDIYNKIVDHYDAEYNSTVAK